MGSKPCPTKMIAPASSWLQIRRDLSCWKADFPIFFLPKIHVDPLCQTPTVVGLPWWGRLDLLALNRPLRLRPCSESVKTGLVGKLTFSSPSSQKFSPFRSSNLPQSVTKVTVPSHFNKNLILFTPIPIWPHSHHSFTTFSQKMVTYSTNCLTLVPSS
jgi:hypothetical protein